MHLLQAAPGDVSDGSEPVDLAQSPADLILLSAADTELSALSQARAALGDVAPSLRLANLTHLGHPFSVDRYLDQTAAHARLVVARILGGEGYWPYGLEQFAVRLAQAGIGFAALPGDDKPDPGLRRASSIADQHYDALWGYLVEGGPVNAANFLRYAQSMLTSAPPPPAPAPLLRAGVYWPGAGFADLATARAAWTRGAPVAPIVFYRALMQSGGLEPIDALINGLQAEGLNPLPVFVASLKDAVSAGTVAELFQQAPPAVVLNATGFAVSSAQAEDWRGERAATVLDAPGAPVLQVVLASGTAEGWAEGTTGLSPRDIAMSVALPEVDGRVLTRAAAFKGEALYDAATECRIAAHRSLPDRVAFTAKLAANWARLAATPAPERRVGLVLANYPNKDGRLANGVGLDAPASAVAVLAALGQAGYAVDGAPADADALMRRILAGPTNWLADRAERQGGEALALEDYHRHFSGLPAAVRDAVQARWGAPEADPFVEDGAIRLSILRFGAAALGVQPARGYNIDPAESYHSPDLVPPHNYFAFYFWLNQSFGAQAIVHLGKHGNLEWLPGKALALSEDCFPEAALGPMPHLYPFIVNDPGEGTQAKRRAQAVIIDHLTPPMTRAESYGPLQALEGLVDEYYEAASVDPRRTEALRKEILTSLSAQRLDIDAGIAAADEDGDKLQKLDAYLCELKESQIRDGLHIFGASPMGDQERNLLVALARTPRGRGGSLIRAIAADLGLLSEAFDPLDCAMATPWPGPWPPALAAVDEAPWRSMGDTVERLERLAQGLVGGAIEAPEDWAETGAVLAEIEGELRPKLRACGLREMAGLLAGLDGRFVAPGPSGAPTRGRPDVLPTGRNFFSVDSRAVPTPTAWSLGWASASLLIERHLQDHGDWPRSMALTVWGTATMRTGGDDLAQALALMGARPRWDQASRRVVGFEILPLSVLGRPRVDVTLRVSGFFRDAFPAQIDLIDSAARAVMALDEPADQNPLAAAWGQERAEMGDHAAGHRVFGAKPGAYGAGLQALIDERLWSDRSDLAAAFLDWGGYAYGAGAEGAGARGAFAKRLAGADAVVQNQDNREHDLLDSDDYYQFEGGMAATVEHLSGAAPAIYHNDHSRHERPVIRSLAEEIGRVVRARAVNPKWIAGVKRHGYKGAFEIAATVDYLFAFAATTHAVRDHHFDLTYEAYLGDEDTRAFIAAKNPAALREIADRYQEAIDRGLWRPRSNSAKAMLDQLRKEEG